MTIELPSGERTLLIEQLADLDQIVEETIREKLSNPYWAYLWPSARALVRELGTGEPLENKRVLDLGCGLGAVGVAAAARGGSVVCADISPDALELAQINAAKNHLSVETRIVDWSNPPAELGAFDRIYAADVFYEDGMLAAIVRFLRAHLAKDGVAMIADPMRVEPSGVSGAARFHGLATDHKILEQGQMMTGGVTLHILEHRLKKR